MKTLVIPIKVDVAITLPPVLMEWALEYCIIADTNNITASRLKEAADKLGAKWKPDQTVYSYDFIKVP
jgi:hypothetical protein